MPSAGACVRAIIYLMLLAHDLNDALAVLRVMVRYTMMCFIGRNNKRPNRKDYIMTYWE
jgi:hypothetical protein